MSDIIDRITSRWTDEYLKQAAPVIAKIKELIAKGVPVEQAVNLAFAETGFSGKIADELKTSLGRAAGEGFGATLSLDAQRTIGAKLFELPWTADKMKLSSRLHGTDALMRQSIVSVIDSQVKAGTNWVQLARKLYDGYGFPETIKRAELPKYLDTLTKAAQRTTPDDSAALQEVKRLARIAKRNLETLSQNDAPNRALKAAYTQLLEKAETGSRKALDKAMEVAVNERSRYYAERIARTEISRAWSEGFWVKNYDDPDVVAVRWRLSSRHPAPDICDMHANVNLYGLGPGTYPKGANPPHPAHPHCTCNLSQVYEGEVDPAQAKFDPIAGVGYLRSLDDKKRQSLMGIDGEKAWKQGESWQKNVRNWLGHDDPGAGVRLAKGDFRFDTQRFASEQEYRDLIGTAAYPTKVRRQVQNRHIEGTEEFKRYEEKLAAQGRGYKPSILTADAQTIVDRFHTKGEVLFEEKANVLSETFNAGEIVGQYWNNRQKQYIDSAWVTIVYSRRGAHAYPVFPEE